MSKTKKGIAGIASLMGMGFAMEVFNSLVSGSDDEEEKSYWDKIPDHLKDMNFIIMLPGNKHIKIPMPYGLNVLPALGRNMAASIMGKQGIVESSFNSINSIANSFNPLGSDNRNPLVNAIPTIGKLPFDLITNTKWTGKRIEKEQPMAGAKVPKFKLAYPSVSKHLVAFAKALNSATGGNEIDAGKINLSPAAIQHVLETFGGGVSKTIIRGADTASRIVSGEPVEAKNIPVGRRFFGKAEDYNVYDDYNELAEYGKKWNSAMTRKDIKWLKANQQAKKVSAYLKLADNKIRAIKKAKGWTDEQKKQRIMSTKKIFNARTRKIMKKNLSK